MKNQTVKILVDAAMTLCLMLLMSYSLIGEQAHEWIGMGMFALFILHHWLNRCWLAGLRRGRYTAFRILQTVTAGLVCLCMVGAMVSAVIISRTVFAFLPAVGNAAFGRTLHLLSAYWGFVCMALHLGVNWRMVMAVVQRGCPVLKKYGKPLAIGALAVSVYGVFAFFRRSLPDYLFLRTHFAYFDFEEPLIFFYLDYLCIMVLFAFVGYILAGAAQDVHHKPGQ